MPVVLGGGIGGLSAAYYLLRRIPVSCKNIKLFESSNRFGGWVRSEAPFENNKSILFESGPRTLRPAGPKGINTLELCTELGLTDVIVPITASHPAARNRMIYVDGKLCPLPSSFISSFRTMPPFSKPLMYAAWNDYRMGAPKGLNDDTIYNFTERRFGPEIAKYLISAMICGICAGDAKEISVKFLMKDFFEYEQNFGGVFKGILNSRKNKKQIDSGREDCDVARRARQEKWSIYSFKGGMQVLPNALVTHLNEHEVEMKTNSACDSIQFDNNRAVVTVAGTQHTTDCLISSLPSYEIGKLLKKEHPALASELLDIPHVDVAVVNLQYDGDLLQKPGFGFLIPPCENLPILGVIYDSCCFDVQGKTVLTVMMGGRWFNERLGANITNEEVLRIAKGQIESILKISGEPEAFKVNVLRKCIPQYVVGHSHRIQRIFQYIKEHDLPIRLCGSAYDGVGVNDVIYSAKQAIESIWLRTSPLFITCNRARMKD